MRPRDRHRSRELAEFLLVMSACCASLVVLASQPARARSRNDMTFWVAARRSCRQLRRPHLGSVSQLRMGAIRLCVTRPFVGSTPPLLLNSVLLAGPAMASPTQMCESTRTQDPVQDSRDKCVTVSANSAR